MLDIDDSCNLLEERYNVLVDPELKSDSGMAVIDEKFPIKSIKDLKTMDKKLRNKDYEKSLVEKFLKVCDRRSSMTLKSDGLFLLSHIITDQCLNMCVWKGIKGYSKVPFVNFINMREFIFKVINQADETCSRKDVDIFLQHTAIKSSYQRLKRRKRYSEGRKWRMKTYRRIVREAKTKKN
nr:uncharacterized protein LOC128672203 [Plodia interpunctella]